jgi:hypothetical protein
VILQDRECRLYRRNLDSAFDRFWPVVAVAIPISGIDPQQKSTSVRFPVEQSMENIALINAHPHGT